jgi:hypothetical protein
MAISQEIARPGSEEERGDSPEEGISPRARESMATVKYVMAELSSLALVVWLKRLIIGASVTIVIALLFLCWYIARIDAKMDTFNTVAERTIETLHAITQTNREIQKSIEEDRSDIRQMNQELSHAIQDLAKSVRDLPVAVAKPPS